MGSRTWIKVYCKPWLEGSLKDDSLELRGFWIDLLAVAGSGQYGDQGIIQVVKNVGLTHQQLATIIGIPYRRVGYFMAKLTDLGRISVDSNNVIRISNWAKYQSEYDRQKPYREAKTTPKSYNQELQQVVTPQSTAGDREGEMRIENEKENKSPYGEFLNIFL